MRLSYLPGLLLASGPPPLGPITCSRKELEAHCVRGGATSTKFQPSIDLGRWTLNLEHWSSAWSTRHRAVSSSGRGLIVLTGADMVVRWWVWVAAALSLSSVAAKAAPAAFFAATQRGPLQTRPRLPHLLEQPRPTQAHPGGLAAALELRGGASALQSLQQGYLGIPVLTRAWFTLILVFAALTQVKLLEPEMVALDAAAIVRRFQLWRPITAAAFFGGLGPQLLQKLYYLIQFGRGLEGTLGLAEYARTLASCTAMMCIVFNLLGWQFLGDGLVMAITVLTCQQNPDAQMNMYGLNVPMAYMPFAQMCMSYFFSQQIPWNDIVGALVVSGTQWLPEGRWPAAARSSPRARPHDAFPPLLFPRSPLPTHRASMCPDSPCPIVNAPLGLRALLHPRRGQAGCSVLQEACGRDTKEERGEWRPHAQRCQGRQGQWQGRRRCQGQGQGAQVKRSEQGVRSRVWPRRLKLVDPTRHPVPMLGSRRPTATRSLVLCGGAHGTLPRH